MKEIIHKYVVMDPSTHLIWQHTAFSHYDTQGHRVYFAKFGHYFTNANIMNEGEAVNAVRNFYDNESEYIQDDALKANLKSLIIYPIKITYEKDS